MDRYVRTIYNKTVEMDHLINELTFYSKIDTNRIPYTFSKLNVEDYFSGLCRGSWSGTGDKRNSALLCQLCEQ